MLTVETAFSSLATIWESLEGCCNVFGLSCKFAPENFADWCPWRTSLRFLILDKLEKLAWYGLTISLIQKLRSNSF